MDILEGLSKRDLIEIQWKLNNWEWDERLGEEPDFFNEMPNYSKTSTFTKSYVITPIMHEIEKRTSNRARYKYHHIEKLGRTRLQFEKWWLQKIIRTKLLGYPI